MKTKEKEKENDRLAEPTGRKAKPSFGKEAKIGVGILLLLVMALIGAVVWRAMRPTTVEQPLTADVPAGDTAVAAAVAIASGDRSEAARAEASTRVPGSSSSNSRLGSATASAQRLQAASENDRRNGAIGTPGSSSAAGSAWAAGPAARGAGERVVQPNSRPAAESGSAEAYDPFHGRKLLTAGEPSESEGAAELRNDRRGDPMAALPPLPPPPTAEKSVRSLSGAGAGGHSTASSGGPSRMRVQESVGDAVAAAEPPDRRARLGDYTPPTTSAAPLPARPMASTQAPAEGLRGSPSPAGPDNPSDVRGMIDTNAVRPSYAQNSSAVRQPYTPGGVAQPVPPAPPGYSDPNYGYASQAASARLGSTPPMPAQGGSSREPSWGRNGSTPIGEGLAAFHRPAPGLRGDGTYEIQPNDSFWTISEKCYGTGAYFKALAEHNRKRISQPDDLKVGDLVEIPSISDLEARYPNLCPKPGRGAIASGGNALASTPRVHGGRVYVTQHGDTLFEIARRELGKASRWTEIYQLNRAQIGNDYNFIPPGLKLVLPDDRQPPDSMTRRPTPGDSPMNYQR